jgi:putative transposase
MMMDAESLKRVEMARRQKMLGDLAENRSASNEQIRERARQGMVPIMVLRRWYIICQRGGPEELIPDMDDLPDDRLAIALERHSKLGPCIDNEIIHFDDVKKIAEENGWSMSNALRWVKSYRTYGMWGLAPGRKLEDSKRNKNAATAKRDIGALSESDLELMYGRYEIIKPILASPTCSQEIVNRRAEEVGISPRTVWNYLSAYRNEGMTGLAPKERADRGGFHGISQKVVGLVQGIRLSHPDLPVLRVYEMAVEKARLLKEIEPSRDQVRRIIRAIPMQARLLADGRTNQYRNSYRFTYRMSFENDVIYQIDHTQVDVLVRDLRKNNRKKGGEVRPWLTMLVDCASRLVLGFAFGYDTPDRFTVASVIRQALLKDDANPFGGVPEFIWVDNGKDFISNHVQTLCREIGVELCNLPPHQPQQKGIIERLFGTLNTRLWSTLPGYVGPNVVKRNPNARASLTVGDLARHLEKFLDQYHNEPHSKTDQTPINFWNENCFTETIDIRRLDVLLMSTATRQVGKTGIKYSGRQYWHPNLAIHVGDSVILRVEPSYFAPDTVEVFHNGQWICTAYADDTSDYRDVPRAVIRNAQVEQKQHLREIIDESRLALKNIDAEINQTNGNLGDENYDTKPTAITKNGSRKRTSSNKKPDLFDLTGDEKW